VRHLAILFIGLMLAFQGCAKRGDYDYRVMINYELGMHCTGFDFEYCCILPPYNSIQAQVVKVGMGKKMPRLLDAQKPGDPTILIDPDTGHEFKLKYELVDNTFSEGGKLVYWKAPFDMNRNGMTGDPGESVANAYFSHLYIYKDLEGSNPEGTSLDDKKIYVGGPNLQVPQDAGPSGQKLSGFLRNSGVTGTIVYTKSPVLENTPIVLTNPGIWEALGLPITPFLDSEVAGRDVKKVQENNVQPYQVAKVSLVDAQTGKPVLNSIAKEVHFEGTNPIDVPNCSNCHSNENVNSGQPGSAGNDNRDAAGGCFVNRDVHSNPNKDKDGVGTPEHLNSLGRWLQANVTRQNGRMKGLWCTNCHSDLSKELYKQDRLAAGEAFNPKPDATLRGKSLEEIAKGLNLTVAQLTARMDPKVVMDASGRDIGNTVGAWKSAKQGRLNAPIGVIATDGKNPIIQKDSDGDVSVELLSMNPDLVSQFASKKPVTPPYDAATHGRDYWLSPGVPHCADCHAAPFVEGQGGAAYPINQPGRYSSMRYSKGHAGLACQACHESIHGLYPVTPNVDRTTYQQAAQLNPDGSHGPLKCQTCHKDVNQQGVPLLAAKLQYSGKDITGNYDLAVQWIHANAPDLGGKKPGLTKTGK